jgi:cystathionine beta-lyase
MPFFETMKVYDFDKIIDRRGTNCVKWDSLKKEYGRDDLLSFWVADMDFETPDFIREAIARRMEHPVYAYSFAPESYWKAIIDWEKMLHGWTIERESMTFIPGIVKGMCYATLCFTCPGDTVVVQSPVYHPFHLVPQRLGRKVTFNPIKPLPQKIEGEACSYEMDLEGLELIFKAERPKMIIISNPQNPTGIAWSKETLSKLADMCKSYGVLVVADEIHADMPLYGNEIHSFLTISDAAAQNAVCFSAPSKTFNIAGLVGSFAVVPNPEIREKFFSFLEAGELDEAMFVPVTAAEAAYSAEGNEWRKQMLSYLEGNIDFVHDFMKDNIPQIKVLKPQASFLVWLDCRGLGLNHDDLTDLFVNKARLALNDGAMFGEGGEGFMRFNVACSRALLKEALERLVDAVRRSRP